MSTAIEVDLGRYGYTQCLPATVESECKETSHAHLQREHVVGSTAAIVSPDDHG